MKKWTKGIISIMVVAVMVCSMVSGFAAEITGANVTVEVLGEDNEVLGTWKDPATKTAEKPISVTSAQMLKITVGGVVGDVTVFSYESNTEVASLGDGNIQYVGQEAGGTSFTIRPRVSLGNGVYVMKIGGTDVTTPYEFTYKVVPAGTVQTGTMAGDIITAAGAQWVKYTLDGSVDVKDGIKIVAMVDMDAVNTAEKKIAKVGVIASSFVKSPTVEAGCFETSSTSVYDQVLVGDADGTATIKASDLKTSGGYSDSAVSHIFWGVLDIPGAKKGETVYATPYIEFEDGERYYGTTKETSWNALQTPPIN